MKYYLTTLLINDEILARVKASEPSTEATLPEWFVVMRSHIESLKFGTVQVTVHDSRIVQIERIEKTRLDRIR